MSAESKSLASILSRIIELQRDVPRINPSAVASAALLELDPGKISVPAVAAGCHLALRQIARRLLRKRFEDADASDDEDDVEPEQSEHDNAAPEPEQADLFPHLQSRYPSSRQSGEYVLREQMSAADLSFNVGRLRKEGATKSKHADALEAWWEIRKGSETVAPAA
jgi:hypothetical protein